jgi:hypothetical protein
MAGSKRWFLYVLDDGSSVGIQADESNVEAINGTAAAVPPVASRPTRTAPAGTKLRFVQYVSTDGNRKIRIPCLTPTIYGAIPAANATITDPITPANTLVFDYKRAEVPRQPKFGTDTGINDGDSPG